MYGYDGATAAGAAPSRPVGYRSHAPSPEPTMAERIEKRARFDLVRYANCWEDAEVLIAALAPAPGKRSLSIASAGDNSFSLVAAGASVVAADLSAPQLATVELKRAAIRRLCRAEALAFLGFAAPARSTARLDTFRGLAGDLSPRARRFWEVRPETIAGGFSHAGKFEGYFTLFRSRVLPWIHGRRTVLSLIEERDHAGREAFYSKHWNNWRWRLLFRLFFSRQAMGRLGRDPEFFRFVEGSVAERILGRARYALTELPTHANPYLEYILTGNFSRTLPHYLRPEPFAALQEAFEKSPERLTLLEGPVDAVAAAEAARGGAGFDGFNLSDIFEYMDAPTAEAVYTRLLAAARPGARLAYWNMLVPRRRPESTGARVRELPELSAALFARDLAFFYSAFVVEEVNG
jgi:S-adenosylmethionine-diacylglycerol 3-amino-3-carboxypropyl transferase